MYLLEVYKLLVRLILEFENRVICIHTVLVVTGTGAAADGLDIDVGVAVALVGTGEEEVAHSTVTGSGDTGGIHLGEGTEDNVGDTFARHAA